MNTPFSGLPFVHIDDNRLDLMVSGKLLEISGLAGALHSFVDPEEALRMLPGLFADEPLVLVLLDIQMPKVNGFELLDRMQAWPEEERSRFKVLMLSSTLAEEDVQRVEAHPLALGLLSKPLDISMLRERIKALAD